MTIFFEDQQPNESYNLYSPNYAEAGFWEELSAAASDSWARAPGVAAKRWLELQDAKTDESKFYAPKEIKDTEWYREDIDYGDGVNESTAQLMAEWHDEEQKRKDVFEASPGGFWRGAARIGVSFGAQFADPLNWALAYVPIVGQARYARWATKIGVAKARMATGFIEGAVGNALVEPLVYMQAQNEQADYTIDDALMSIGLGGVIGGTIHTGAGFIGDLAGWTKSPKDILLHEKMMRYAGGDLNKLYEVRDKIDEMDFNNLVDKYGYRSKVHEQVLTSKKYSPEQANFFLRVLDNIADSTVNSGLTGVDGTPITHRDQFYEYWWTGTKELSKQEWFNVKLKQAVEAKRKELTDAGKDVDELYVRTKEGEFVKLENIERYQEVSERINRAESDARAVEEVIGMVNQNREGEAVRYIDGIIDEGEKKLKRIKADKKVENKSERIDNLEKGIARLNEVRKAALEKDVAKLQELVQKKRAVKDTVSREMEPVFEKLEMSPEALAERTVPSPETRVRGAVEGLFNDMPKIITMMEGGDLTTLVHETGHILTEMIYRNRENNPYDWSIITKFVGADQDTPHSKWTTDQKEKMAKAFEFYLMNNEAPSPELKGVFAKMKAWMLGIYKAVKAEVLSNDPNSPFRGMYIDNDIKAVFDKWTAESRDKAAYTDVTRQAYFREEVGDVRNEMMVEGDTAVAGTQSYGFQAPPLPDDIDARLMEEAGFDIEDMYGPVTDEAEMDPDAWADLMLGEDDPYIPDYAIDNPQGTPEFMDVPDDSIPTYQSENPRFELEQYVGHYRRLHDDVTGKIKTIEDKLDSIEDEKLLSSLEDTRDALLDRDATYRTKLIDLKEASDRMESGEDINPRDFIAREETYDDGTVYQKEWDSVPEPPDESREILSAFAKELEDVADIANYFEEKDIVKRLSKKEKEIRRKVRFLMLERDAGVYDADEFAQTMEKLTKEANEIRMGVGAIRTLYNFINDEIRSGRYNNGRAINLSGEQKVRLKQTYLSWYRGVIDKVMRERGTESLPESWVPPTDFETRYADSIIDKVIQDWNGKSSILNTRATRAADSSRIKNHLIKDLLEKQFYSRDRIVTTEIKKFALIDRIKRFGMGLVPRELEAMLVGSNRRVPGARASVDAAGKSLGYGWAGRFIRRLKEDGVYEFAIKRRVDGRKQKGDVIDREIAIELWEDREGGNFGVTGNKQAMKVAKAIHELQDEILERLNMAGARVKKLQGYIVRQTHDVFKLRKQGKEEWINFLVDNDLLDVPRTFNRAVTKQEAREILSTIYEDIVAGGAFKIERVAGLEWGISSHLAAKRSQHRELHFKSAEDWFQYNKRFGSKDLIPAVISSLIRAGKDVAMLEKFGPDPRKTFEDILNWMDDQVTKGELPRKRWEPRHKQKLVEYFDELDGTASIPVDNLIASVGRFARAWNNLTMLGTSVASAFADTPMFAAEMRFQGGNFLINWGKAILNPLFHYTSKERREIAEEIGLGLETLIGGVMTRFSAKDTLSGGMAKWQDRFFKAVMLPQWTDAHKTAMAVTMAHSFGKRAGLEFDKLPDELQNLLNIYDIGKEQWDVIRKGVRTARNGKELLTPEGIRGLSDEVIERYLQITGYLPAQITDRRGIHMKVKDARNNLTNAFRMMIIDRADFGTPTPGAREVAKRNFGQKPGTVLGEVVRCIMQFKTFPFTIMYKPMAREMFGSKSKAGAIYNVSSLLLALTLSGYIAKSMHDMLKGREPRLYEYMKEGEMPPAELLAKTFTESFIQGGGAGIYGDFLYGATMTRYGQGPVESFLGPTYSTASDVVKLAVSDIPKAVMEGKPIAYKALRIAKRNTPFQNLWWSRLVTDNLYYGLAEAVNPGYINRLESAIYRETEQEFWVDPYYSYDFFTE